MPKYECQACHKTYDVKEFELMDKDYCSHDCLMVARNGIKEREQPKETSKMHLHGWGQACY